MYFLFYFKLILNVTLSLHNLNINEKKNEEQKTTKHVKKNSHVVISGKMCVYLLAFFGLVNFFLFVKEKHNDILFNSFWQRFYNYKDIFQYVAKKS